MSAELDAQPPNAAQNAIPEKSRQAVYDSAIIERLLNIGALEREMICYALYKRDNHMWADDTERSQRWILNLRTAGLIDVSSADWNTVHYEIHPVAWSYMRRYPTKFINLVLWPREPWTLSQKKESEVQQMVERAVAKKGTGAIDQGVHS